MTDETPETPAGPHKMWVGIGEAIHNKVQGKVTAARVEATTDMLERLERDLAPLVRPVAARALADPETPDEVRPILTELADPEHFSGSIVVSFAVGAIVGPALGAALAPIVQVLSNNAWAALPNAPLSPAILTAMALKGIDLNGAKQLGPTDLATEAAMSGIDASRFAAMTQAAGQAIGFEEALLLERRGQLAPETLDSVLEYSNANPRFYDAAKLLILQSPAVASVLAGELKHHLDPKTAARLYAEAGGNPTNHDWELASLGRPLALETMVEWRNRTNAGLADVPVVEADVQQALAQSDINNDYAKWTPNLGVYFPPVRSIVPLLRAGALTPEQATKLFQAQGVRPDDITAYLAEGAHGRTTTVRELTSAQVVRMYSTKLLDQPTALGRLEALRYPAEDAQLLLTFADDAAEEALANATLRGIGSRYVGRKITLVQATNAMGAAGIPPAAQTLAVKYWDIERTVNVHVPSPAAVMGAFRRGDIDGAETRTRLIALGVDPTDLHIVAADGFPPTKPNPQGTAIVVAGSALYVNGTNLPPATGARAETVQQITNLYLGRVIDKPTAVARFEALGDTAQSANDLVALAGSLPPLPTTGA